MNQGDPEGAAKAAFQMLQHLQDGGNTLCGAGKGSHGWRPR